MSFKIDFDAIDKLFNEDLQIDSGDKVIHSADEFDPDDDLLESMRSLSLSYEKVNDSRSDKVEIKQTYGRITQQKIKAKTEPSSFRDSDYNYKKKQSVCCALCKCQIPSSAAFEVVETGIACEACVKASTIVAVGEVSSVKVDVALPEKEIIFDMFSEKDHSYVRASVPKGLDISKVYFSAIKDKFYDVNLCYKSTEILNKFVAFVEVHLKPLGLSDAQLYSFPMAFDIREKSGRGAAYMEFLGDAVLKEFHAKMIGRFSVAVDKYTTVRSNMDNNNLFGKIARSIGLSTAWGAALGESPPSSKAWGNVFEILCGYLSICLPPETMKTYIWSVAGRWWLPLLHQYPSSNVNVLRDIIMHFHVKLGLPITYQRRVKSVRFKIYDQWSRYLDEADLSVQAVVREYERLFTT